MVVKILIRVIFPIEIDEHKVESVIDEIHILLCHMVIIVDRLEHHRRGISVLALNI